MNATPSPIAPNLLIAGAQKSGTTWLHGQLSRHPEIFLSKVKEIGYLHTRKGSIDEYLSHFEGSEGFRWRGEATPQYFWRRDDRSPFSPGGEDRDTAEFARSVLGEDVTVLVSLRDPVSRSISGYFHNLAMGRVSLEESVFRTAPTTGIIDLSFYRRHLDHWSSVFGADRVHVLLFDDLASDPRAYVDQALDVLGVDRALLGELDARRTGERQQTLRIKQSRNPITPQEVGALLELFLDDIAAVEEATGRDLSHWRDLDRLLAKHCPPQPTGAPAASSHDPVHQIPLPPPRVSQSTLAPDEVVPAAVALVERLRRHGLADDQSVLDIGSGDGRLPTGLLATGFRGTYRGFDILSRHVRWCRRSLAPLADGRFEFAVRDVRNGYYHPQGTTSAWDVTVPTGQRRFDVVAVIDVFTHMYESEIRHYLDEIRTALAPDGRAITTWYLIDDERLPAATDRGFTQVAMVNRLNDMTRFARPGNPLWAISYDAALVAAMVADAGLEVVAEERGTWSTEQVDDTADTLVLRAARRPAPERGRDRLRRRREKEGG